MTRLPVVEHLTPAEIERRYRTCTDAAEKSRWHVLWLVTRPDRPVSATAAALFAALQADPPDGGLWSGPKVAAFVKGRFGVEVWPQTGWQWLKNLGFRLVVPRPRHPKAATPDEQRVWL